MSTTREVPHVAETLRLQRLDPHDRKRLRFRAGDSPTTRRGHAPEQEDTPIRALTVLAAAATLLVCAVPAAKSATPKKWPTTRAAKAWKPDRSWLRGAFCIHNHESVDWHLAWRDYRGNRSPYAGGMQFLQSTWTNAGGLGEPWQWSPREQLYRAFRVWKADGGSWREWGTAGACGLA